MPAAKSPSRTLQWTAEEDEFLKRTLMAANEDDNEYGGVDSAPLHGTNRWSYLAALLQPTGRGRTGRQIRDRWNNHLNPALDRRPFSREDDLRIWEGYRALGSRWVEIGIREFGERRSENQIKNRWNSAGFKKFVAKEFGAGAYERAKRESGARENAVRAARNLGMRTAVAAAKNVAVPCDGRDAEVPPVATPRRSRVADIEPCHKPGDRTVQAKRPVFVPAVPPSPFEGLMYSNEPTEDARPNMKWQQKWMGTVREVGGQRLIVVHEAFVSEEEEASPKGGGKRRQQHGGCQQEPVVVHEPFASEAGQRGGKRHRVVGRRTLPSKARHLSSTALDGYAHVDASSSSSSSPRSKRRKSGAAWTAEEERLVERTVTSNQDFDGNNPSTVPFSRWTDLASLLPGRTSKQIRDRWTNYLDPSLDRGPFSREDDVRLWNAHREFGNRWVDIGAMEFKSRRSENQIKNRWYSVGFRKFVAMEYGAGAYEDARKA